MVHRKAHHRHHTISITPHGGMPNAESGKKPSHPQNAASSDRCGSSHHVSARSAQPLLEISVTDDTKMACQYIKYQGAGFYQLYPTGQILGSSVVRLRHSSLSSPKTKISQRRLSLCQLPYQQNQEVEKLHLLQGLHDIDHLQDTPREY
jgi:hypothetical protein